MELIKEYDKYIVKDLKELKAENPKSNIGFSNKILDKTYYLIVKKEDAKKHSLPYSIIEKFKNSVDYQEDFYLSVYVNEEGVFYSLTKEESVFDYGYINSLEDKKFDNYKDLAVYFTNNYIEFFKEEYTGFNFVLCLNFDFEYDSINIQKIENDFFNKNSLPREIYKNNLKPIVATFLIIISIISSYYFYNNHINKIEENNLQSEDDSQRLLIEQKKKEIEIKKQKELEEKKNKENLFFSNIVLEKSNMIETNKIILSEYKKIRKINFEDFGWKLDYIELDKNNLIVKLIRKKGDLDSFYKLQKKELSDFFFNINDINTITLNKNLNLKFEKIESIEDYLNLKNSLPLNKDYNLILTNYFQKSTNSEGFLKYQKHNSENKNELFIENYSFEFMLQDSTEEKFTFKLLESLKEENTSIQKIYLKEDFNGLAIKYTFKSLTKNN